MLKILKVPGAGFHVPGSNWVALFNGNTTAPGTRHAEPET